MEILLAGFVLLAVYMLEEHRISQIVAWIQEFMDYLERQQQQQQQG